MPSRFLVGDTVQTPLGKGVVSEVRRNGRLVVTLHGRSLVLEEHEVKPLESRRRRRAATEAAPPTEAAPRHAGAEASPLEMDLHGLTVEEALERVALAINAALLDDRPELRLIHGRGGGRIKAALHRRLREMPPVRSFEVDPRNPGVTIVRF